MANQKLKCSNPDHQRPVDAAVRIVWPDGRFYPVLACKTCLRRNVFFYVLGAEGEKHPMLVLPLDYQPQYEAEGRMHALRMSVHRAIADPGKVLPRERSQLADQWALEALPDWQSRAVLAVTEPLLELAGAEAVDA
jgi:hypothetical protein